MLVIHFRAPRQLYLIQSTVQIPTKSCLFTLLISGTNFNSTEDLFPQSSTCLLVLVEIYSRHMKIHFG